MKKAFEIAVGVLCLVAIIFVIKQAKNPHEVKTNMSEESIYWRYVNLRSAPTTEDDENILAVIDQCTVVKSTGRGFVYPRKAEIDPEKHWIEVETPEGTGWIVSQSVYWP